jgi:large repetitive protein
MAAAWSSSHLSEWFKGIGMRLSRPPDAASNRTPAGEIARARRRAGIGLARLVSVTAVAAAACALWAAPAGAAPANVARRLPTTTHISARPARAFVRQKVMLSATVRSRGSIPTGTVRFTWNGVTLCTARLRHGSGACATRFSRARRYLVKGTYARNSRFRGSSGFALVRVVNPPPPAKHHTVTTINGFSPNPVLAGHPSAVSVTVTSVGGGAVPTGTVVIAPVSPTGLPASYSCTATLAAGKGSCKVTPGAGTFGDTSYEATYSGDAGHTGSVSTGSHVLIVPETTTTSVSPAAAAHGSVTLTATVIGQAKGNISPSAGGTGTVNFTITQGTTTVATCSKAPLTYNGAGANMATCPATLAAGTYSVKAVYTGDPNNLTSTGTETLTVS